MSKLNKEEVLQQLNDAYLAKHGKTPEIEQKGSWFKVDGGKSLRLGDLADMVKELTDGAQPVDVASKAEPKKSEHAKNAAPKKAAKVTGNGGMTPKQLWAKKLAQGSTPPRGQR